MSKHEHNSEHDNHHSKSGGNSSARGAARLRFIAGARCPSCDAVDRIKVGPHSGVASHDGALQRLCVACGFTDTIDSLGAVSEPANRLQRAPEPESSPVRLVNPSDPASSEGSNLQS